MSDLYKNLQEYVNTDYYPFHMPGHKRNIIDGKNPYSYDITEIEGFDDLHNPQGILRIAMEEAANFYGSDNTYFLINGSSCGILSAICGTTKKKDKILIARNSHKSVYNGVYLNELVPIYVYPEYVNRYGFSGGINPMNVEKALMDNKGIRAVVITSPTYEGIVSDIAAIGNIVHKYKIPLIVDEAHGAHFSMNPNFPKSALELGADIVIQSVHKTLPSLTQTALLHVKSKLVDKGEIEKYLRIYQTSSPSYVLLSSIDQCIKWIKEEGKSAFPVYIKRLEAIQKCGKELTHISIVDDSIIGKNSIFSRDPSKIVISTRKCNMTGVELYQELSDKFKLQLEMATCDYVIAMTSPMDTEEGLLRLFKALAQIDRDIRIEALDYSKILKERLNYDKNCHDGDNTLENNKMGLLPGAIVLKSISEVDNEKFEVIKLSNSPGRISREFVYVYPPGIPIIAPGEMITKECVDIICMYREKGLNICGTKSKGAALIEVVQEEFKRIDLFRNEII